MTKRKLTHPNQNPCNPLLIGSFAGNPIYIPDQSLQKNGLMIIGTKNSGKSELLSELFLQQIIAPYNDENGTHYSPLSDAGVTYVVSTMNQAYYLYAVARKYHRNGIRLLKPSANMKVRTGLLGLQEYNYNTVNEVINYEKAIRDRETVIIDMEASLYESAGIQAVGMLLMQLQIAMRSISRTLKRRHYLVIDDAYQYLPYLEPVLKYGNEYNITVILLFRSRGQYRCFSELVESNIQNMILMPVLNYEDSEYFSGRFLLGNTKEKLGCGNGEIYYAFYDERMRIQRGFCDQTVQVTDPHEKELLETSARRYRRILELDKGDDLYARSVMEKYAQYRIECEQKFETGTPLELVLAELERTACTVEAASKKEKTDTKADDELTIDDIAEENLTGIFEETDIDEEEPVDSLSEDDADMEEELPEEEPMHDPEKPLKSQLYMNNLAEIFSGDSEEVSQESSDDELQIEEEIIEDEDKENFWESDLTNMNFFFQNL